jgi:Secretion system C-terminal sorting domain/Right handed beta helix region
MRYYISLFFFIFVISFTINTSATNYYVSSTGNDSNNGTSLNTAFKTIDYAVNYSALTGGDVIYIRGGNYYERIIMQKSGTSDASRILIKNYNNEQPVIDGTGMLWDYIDGVSGLFEIRSRYVTLDGIKVKNAVANANAAGILVRGPSTSFVTVIRCVTENTRTSGIAIWGRTDGTDYSGATDIRIESCDISEAVNDGYQEHLTIAQGVDRFVICWNKVHDSTKEPKTPNLPIGIDAKVNVRNGKIYNNEVWNLKKSNGIYVDAWDSEAYNIEIYNNIIHDIDHTGIPIGAEEGGSAHDIKVYNNLIYNAGWDGLAISRENNTLGNNRVSQTYNVSFYNNTVYGCKQYAAHVLNGNSPNCVFKNNIFSQNNWSNAITVYSGNKNNITVENNITDGVQNAWLQGMEIKLGTNNISQSPEFAWADGNNYRLGSTSPAINAGTNSLKPIDDLDGNSRSNTGIVDIGAYEYGATTLSNFRTETTSASLNSLKAYPNPSKNYFEVSFASSNKQDYALELTNLLGQVVYAEKLNGFEGDYSKTINTSNLMKGIYVLKLSSDNSKSATKVIIQ